MVAASGGNHGLAVAFVAAQSKIPARIYVPENAPPVKVAKLHKLGAEVVQVGQKYADAYEAGAKYAVESGALFCHAYDQPDICSGQGTLGIELLEQTGGQLDTILVAVGGGGLLAGIATATEGQVRVVGVEPANAPTLHAALAAGQPGRRAGIGCCRRFTRCLPGRRYRLRGGPPHRSGIGPGQ